MLMTFGVGGVPSSMIMPLIEPAVAASTGLPSGWMVVSGAAEPESLESPLLAPQPTQKAASARTLSKAATLAVRGVTAMRGVMRGALVGLIGLVMGDACLSRLYTIIYHAANRSAASTC